jgi:hypothetical protein
MTNKILLPFFLIDIRKSFGLSDMTIIKNGVVNSFFRKKNQPLQKYAAFKLLYNSALNAKIRGTSLTKQSAMKLK